MLGPWRWLGVLQRSHTIRVALFTKYVESKSRPSIYFSSLIKARSPPGPEILGARVNISLRAGLLQKILFYARPQSVLGKVLGVAAFVASIGGSSVLYACFYVYMYGKDDIDSGIGEQSEDDTLSLNSSDLTSGGSVPNTPRSSIDALGDTLLHSPSSRGHKTESEASDDNGVTTESFIIQKSTDMRDSGSMLRQRK